MSVDRQRNHVIISMNPKAGGSSSEKSVRAAEKALQERGFSVQVLTDIDEMVASAEKLFEDQCLAAVVSAGGDGTIALLVNRLRKEIPIAILPLGTENLLAKQLKIKNDPNELADIIESNRQLKIDSGLANNKRFLVMASVGFDAHVVHRTHSNRTGHINQLSYFGPAIRGLWKYKFPKLKVFVDDNPEPTIAGWAFAFNFPTYAVGLKIVPEGDGSDGIFEVATFRKATIVSGFWYLFSVLLKRHYQFRDFKLNHFKKTLRLEVDSNGSENDAEVPFQIDGDPGGVLPLEITIDPLSVTLIVPEQK